MVSVGYTRPYEISVEVSERTLQEYNLTLRQSSQRDTCFFVRHAGRHNQIQRRRDIDQNYGQAYVGEEFADVVVLTRPDGTRLLLDEIAEIKDTFEEGFLMAEFDGRRAAMINVSQVETEDLIQNR